jgi:hypothetical protein
MRRGIKSGGPLLEGWNELGTGDANSHGFSFSRVKSQAIAIIKSAKFREGQTPFQPLVNLTPEKRRA